MGLHAYKSGIFVAANEYRSRGRGREGGGRFTAKIHSFLAAMAHRRPTADVHRKAFGPRAARHHCASPTARESITGLPPVNTSLPVCLPTGTI